MADTTTENPLARLKLYSDEELKNRRAAAKRGKKLLEALHEVLATLDADTSTLELVQGLDPVLDRLNPPDLKKCKEYLRALKRSQKGLPGIDPEDVVLYCSCAECRDVRDRFGLDQPADEDAEQLLERKIAEKLAQFEAERQAEEAPAPESAAADAKTA